MIHCKQDKHTEAQNDSTVDSLPAHFEAFYAKFHSDTSFQREHIVFPLAEQADGQPWTGEAWEFHKNPLESDTKVTREIKILGSLVNELIYDDTGFFVIHRRFAKTTDSSWNLIYYSITQNLSDWDKVYENSPIDIKPLSKK